MLGPAAAWLMTALPLLLVPPIAAPLTSTLPESLGSVVAVGGAGLVITMILAGRLANTTATLFGKKTTNGLGNSSESIIKVPPLIREHQAAAARLLRSGRVAAGAATVGCAMSLMAHWISSDERLSPYAIGPALGGATVSLYVAASVLVPSGLRKLLPPTIVSGIGLVCLLTSVGLTSGEGMPAVRSEAARYMDGAGKFLMMPVPAALVTLGLMPHTHRELLQLRLKPILATVAVAAPVAFLGTGLVGSFLLRADPSIVASMMPGTTTTGLALTMHGASLPPARPEWLALGPAVCGLTGMVAWPAILAMGGLASASPWVKGIAVGSASHVAGMAALAAAGETVAAEWAALAFFLFGTFRCLLLQSPWYRDISSWAAGAEGNSGS